MHNPNNSFISNARKDSNELLANGVLNFNLQTSEQKPVQVNKNIKTMSTSHNVVIYSSNREPHYQEPKLSPTMASEPATQAKIRFLKTISREIMEPLTNIIDFSDLLGDTDMPTLQKEQTRHIINASLQLQKLLNEALAFADLNSDEVSIENLPLSPSSLLSQIWERISKTALVKGISVNVAIDPLLPALLGDERLLNHAMDILATNAVKFTKQGRITLSVQLLDSQEGRVQVAFAVKDTGIGIPMYRQNEISQRLDPSNSHKPSSMGLGLLICKRLVKLLGGKLSFESQFGSGSQFHISLWLETNLTG